VITDEAIREAATGLSGVAIRTPLTYTEPLGAYLKLESLQPTGAFKLRGAYTAVRRLPEAVRRRGVITYSSGNHGQAVAFAARQFGVRAVIVMPETAPEVKVAGVRRWGGEVVLAGRTSEERLRTATALAEREDLAVVPPFDHPDVIAGQATLGLELAEQLPEVRSVVVPVGGGGLIAGVVAGLAAAGSTAEVWGVEPVGAAKLRDALAAGAPVRLARAVSVADGLLPLAVGDLPWAVLQAHRARLRGVVCVDDDSITAAMHFLRKRCAVTAEPSGAVTAAALRGGGLRPDPPAVLVVSGGNLDAALLEGETAHD
jgi:threonine dehydratase